jgi:hypothetical protein
MKKVKVSHKGRICKYPCCKIVLSIYNHGCYCYLHQDRLVAQDRLKTPQSAHAF